REERPEYIKIVKTGTDDRAVEVINYDDFDTPAIMRQGRRRAAPSTDFSNPEVSDSYDIPAFLRKQAD
ncbi:MAG: cell division protein FtsZ, partial [Aquitalea sp.]|nr:cell division protein FtsZ [Aquitalea sp.]